MLVKYTMNTHIQCSTMQLQRNNEEDLYKWIWSNFQEIQLSGGKKKQSEGKRKAYIFTLLMKEKSKN